MHLLFEKVLAAICISTLNVCLADGPITLITSLIQNNLLGSPTVHQVTKWEFDPEVAIKRRETFQQTNGYRGEKLIERIGLGIDGLHHERLAIQRERDEGLLGGSIHHIKSGLNTIDRV